MELMVKKIFSYYKFSALKNKINDMGFDITPKYLAMYLLITAAISFFAGAIIKLTPVYSLMIVLAFILTTPFTLIYRFKFNYEQNRFNDIVDYMQRVIYSYQKNGKIYSTLKDVREVVSPSIQHDIDAMLKFIDEGAAKENLYREAFDIIESHYKCARLNTLHSYLIDAELNGGEGTETLALLLQDIREWSIRTKEYKAERVNIKAKAIMSIGLGLITIVAALYMVPSEYVNQMRYTTLYQVGTTVVLILYILLYLYVIKSLAIPYLDAEIDDLNAYKRSVNRVKKFDKKKVTKKTILAIVLASGFSMIAHVLGFDMLIIPIVILFAFTAYQPMLTYKADKKRIVREVNKAFPVWVRNIVLLLQTNNVGRSIQKSLVTCPLVMKPHVEKLLMEIDEMPDKDIPFTHFCQQYDLPDIATTMSFLYYLSSFGSDEMLGQLDFIVKQNSYLTMNEERIRNSDSLSMMTMLVLVPMLISIIKLTLDMYSLYDVFSTIMMNSGF